MAKSKRSSSLSPASSALATEVVATTAQDQVSWLSVFGARHNNLCNVDVHFPLGRFIAVTGVSGSGKSSLVNDILREALARDLNGAITAPGEHERITGLEYLDKIIDIDQSPIGRTPRSNPATYIKLFDEIRDLYTQLTEAKLRGYAPGRFSFNVSGGRCEACEGNGSNRLEMDFLADVWITCPVCGGRRFNRETLQVRFKDKNIHDVLEMDIQEALEHFENIPRVRGMLQTLHDVGLDYLKLGQPSPTLSGGEAQRIKLARELCKRSTGRTLYVLDEPTTGLHFEDVRKLLQVLHGFVDAGNTVIVIEHHLDVIKTADWVIDLGPEGGSRGGQIVAVGTPEQVADQPHSHTGQALRALLFPTKTHANSSKKTAANPRRGKPFTHLEIEGAAQHNLKDVSTRIPLHEMTVFCGPSGSGKSSLAIDTIYAEGQRRYVESLSSYARQFLGQMQKPRVERVTGLAPAICIEQKAASKSPRSTVGTVTEIYDYFRILMARLGHPYCPDCQVAIGTQTSDEIIDKLLLLPDASKVYILAPLPRDDAATYTHLWGELQRKGFMRMRVDGVTYEVANPPEIDRKRKHLVEVVIDRLVIHKNQRGRVADAVETALEMGQGVLHVARVEEGVEEKKWKVERFSQHFACDRCRRSFQELSPNHFSFNAPIGWCRACEGLGVQAGSGSASHHPNGNLTIRQGAIPLWPRMTDPLHSFTIAMEAIAKHVGFSLDVPFDALLPDHKRAVLYGTGDEWISLPDTITGAGATARIQYKGVFPALSEASRVSWLYRQQLSEVVGQVACPTCQGSRLHDAAAAVRFADRTLGEWCALPLRECLAEMRHLKLGTEQKKIASELTREITQRLQFLVDVGLDYLTLGRPTPTLSGGEAQRIRLASQLGSGLTGVLYLLDEPTIGLHPRDNGRLLRALQQLRDLGNTLILVEHDREVIEAADHVLDFGPGSGRLGGSVVAQGNVSKIQKTRESLTGQYLAGKTAISVPTNRRAGNGALLEVIAASQNNLRRMDAAFPLGCFIAVTGVSGSGKSSLIHDVLWAALAKRLHRAQVAVGLHEEIKGLQHIDKVINVDQQPLGNTPTSNPATYTGLFDNIRTLFAQLPEAKVRGFHPNRFSFNKPGGRCEACEGMGQKKIEMHFLPDVWIECDICKGKRYTQETLTVTYKERSIADVLDMTVADALELLQNFPKIRRILETLRDVGLEYITLGQSAPTLSGGEAQRVKLAAELARPSTGKTVYILDEPTTGLHFDDVRKLLEVLQRLVDLGNTVIVIEHNLDVIKCADWVVDMGPEAGEEGGQIVVAGTPETVAKHGETRRKGTLPSHTGMALAPILARGPHARRDPFDPLAAATPRENDLELHQVSKEVAMPWQIDGERWHLRDRIARNGQPAQWEGEALAWVVQEIQGRGNFAPTDWNDRALVEIHGPKKTEGWFFHALTGEEWFLTLKFRAARGTFQKESLKKKFNLQPFYVTRELPIFTTTSRVTVRPLKSVFQEIEITTHKLVDIKTKVFDEFLDQAIASFQRAHSIQETNPEDAMPWMVDGERWHRSDKGFRPGRRRVWASELLDFILQCLESATSDGTWDWKSRDSVKRRLQGATMSWARLMTKDETALELVLVGAKGQFNLAALDRLGARVDLVTDHERWDTIKLSWIRREGIPKTPLCEFLSEHAKGFRAAFRK